MRYSIKTFKDAMNNQIWIVFDENFQHLKSASSYQELYDYCRKNFKGYVTEYDLNGNSIYCFLCGVEYDN